jgi:hypothetical protein
MSSNSKVHLKIIKEKLAKYGELKWESKTTDYLGIHLEQQPDHSVLADMSADTEKFLKKRDIKGFKDSPSTDQLFSELDDNSNDYSDASTDFKSQLMELMYLARIRFDILKEVCFLAKSSKNPGPIAYKKLKRLQQYINKTKNFKVKLGADRAEIVAYIDASYATHVNSRSHTGVYITIGNSNSPLSTKSSAQKLVTTSSTEAELLALTEGIKRAIPLGRLLKEIGLKDDDKVKVKQDNMSTILIAKGGEGYGGKSKHFRVRYHFIKELIEAGILEIEYCPTKSMIADILTKPMTGNSANAILKLTSAKPEN